MTANVQTTGPGSGPGTGLGLNDILNILWRHRGLILGMTLAGGVAGFAYGQIVTPLYLASATVQPGISTFTVQGQPQREWRIHDIVQWYRRGDFNPAVANLLQADPTEFRPIIRASYVPRGPQSKALLAGYPLRNCRVFFSRTFF